MWKFIRQFVKRIKKDAYVRRQIEVAYVVELVKEVLDLIEISEKVFAHNGKLLQRLKKIRLEVNRVQQLVNREDYDFLPLSTRIDMARTLELTRERLEESLVKVEPKTDKVQ